MAVPSVCASMALLKFQAHYQICPIINKTTHPENIGQIKYQLLAKENWLLRHPVSHDQLQTFLIAIRAIANHIAVFLYYVLLRFYPSPGLSGLRRINNTRLLTRIN